MALDGAAHQTTPSAEPTAKSTAEATAEPTPSPVVEAAPEQQQEPVVASSEPAEAAALLARGFSRQDVARIMGENWLDFFDRGLKPMHSPSPPEGGRGLG